MSESQQTSNKSWKEISQILDNSYNKLNSSDDLDEAVEAITASAPALKMGAEKLAAATQLASELFDVNSTMNLVKQVVTPILSNQKVIDSVPEDVRAAMITLAEYNPA